MQTQIIDEELTLTNEDDVDTENTEEESKTDIENNLAKFNIQVQDRYEDI